MTNTRNTPIEALEAHLPVRVLRYKIRRGSGGRGRHRGGDGVEKALRFMAPVRMTWVAQRQESGPWGLAGGRPGRPGAARLLVAGARRGARMTGQTALEVEAGATVVLKTPGGGGYGRSG